MNQEEGERPSSPHTCICIVHQTTLYDGPAQSRVPPPHLLHLPFSSFVCSPARPLTREKLVQRVAESRILRLWDSSMHKIWLATPTLSETESLCDRPCLSAPVS